MKDEIEERFNRNLERVRRLVEVYKEKSEKRQGRRPVHAADILRAATVFLHATLEDFLRSLEAWKLPAADPTALDGIALAGLGPRVDRFHLGALAAHRGKSVEHLIEESVEQHLERKTYNDVETVVAVLKRLRFDTSSLTPQLSNLGELILRRHNIVHRADRDDTPGQGHHKAKSIGKWHLQTWTDAVHFLVIEVLKQA